MDNNRAVGSPRSSPLTSTTAPEFSPATTTAGLLSLRTGLGDAVRINSCKKNNKKTNKLEKDVIAPKQRRRSKNCWSAGVLGDFDAAANILN